MLAVHAESVEDFLLLRLPLFEQPIVEAIYRASNGLPRKANSLAHHSLFAAAIARAKAVTTEHVQGVA